MVSTNSGGVAIGGGGGGGARSDPGTFSNLQRGD